MKVRIVICIIAVLLVFTGASPWEGAAAVASDGELPATGRYVATNSFPVNTIVDITNIENNRSTRVIVANNLNSPGLLAVVSAEAAELIGMRQGSVSRIRMVQPSDPIAYLRFTEGIDANIPEYYSGNAFTEEQLLNEVYGTDTYTTASGGNSGTAQADSLRGPSYTLEPEWSGRRIIDLPGYAEYPEYPPVESQTEIAQTPVDETPQYIARIPEQSVPIETVTEIPEAVEQEQGEIIKVIDEKIDETPNDEVIKDISEYIVEFPREEAEKDVPEYIAEVPANEVEKDIAEYIAEVPANEAEKDVAEKIEEEPREEIAKDIEPGQYVLVPTDERPPENTIYGIDPSDIIPGVTAAPPQRETTSPPPVSPPVTQPITPPVAPTVTEAAFSVPRIFTLDRGSYYVQLASLNSPESVEAAINQMKRQTSTFDSYKPAVYKDGDNWYRILLGPFNQGESAAVLQRFKSIGFSDAFVRRNTW